MIRNYLKIAFRNLWKSKTFSGINIMGLSVGMAAVILILQYVDFETSYDRMHERADRIYRAAMQRVEADGKEQTFAFTYPAVAPAMRREFPEVETAVRFRRTGMILSREETESNERVYFVDSTLLDIFSFPVVMGDGGRALSQPFTGMISESYAHKFFGGEDPIGQYLETDDGHRFEIAAVFADIPENSHIDFDVAFSYITYVQVMAQRGGDAENNWGWSDFYTYLLLKENADIEALRAKMPAFVERHKGESMRANNYELTFMLQPLRDIHLRSDLGYELQVNGNIRYIYFLGLIALFIILIAWFNYINLSTARSLDRAREVGVRKVVGASRGQLIRQFLFESAIVNFIALSLALFIVQLVFPAFRDLTGRGIQLTLFETWKFWLLASGLFLGGSLLAGLYPAFVLSKYRPISVLKSSLSRTVTSGEGLRRGLVALQFISTIALLAGTFVVYRQLQFMRQQELGVNIEETLVLRDYAYRDTTYAETIRSFKEELKRHPDVVSVTASGDVPGKEVGNSWGLRWERSPSPSFRRARTFAVDDQFIDQYDLELIAGRPFSDDYRRTDEVPLIINETAMRIFGIPGPEEAIGEVITSGDSPFGRIVGVLKDYHQEALKFNFKPIVFYHGRQGWTFYSLKLNTSDVQDVVNYAEQQWRAHFPGSPFSSFFLDEFFNQQYLADRRFGQIFGLFTILAILVASLGLFGLSSFSVARRTKEIGIRKVLGASVRQILFLLSKEYFRLILVAGLVALPFAYWLMRRWLTNYAYHIELGWWFFLVPFLAVLFIAALTVSYQSIRAATANPVEALRYE
jgi:putative ABC transport system permease protein